MPTQDPFLYVVSATATEGTGLAAVEATLLEEIERVRRDGITEAELTKVKAQLKARLVFESDSVSNIAHQIGFFETVASLDVFSGAPARIASVTIDEVAEAARSVCGDSNRTVGCFEPLPVDARGET